jgi:metal-responsive CopG/Arc/MetJ family transcriptional regulator
MYFYMRFNIMTTLSITLPDPLAKASREVAKKLGVSRTQFIRIAIAHELENFKQKSQQEEIVNSFSVMKKSKDYLQEAEKIYKGFDTDLPDEGDEWWKKK